MKIEEITLTPVWVNSQHLLQTAKYVMLGHNLKAVGVVDNGKFVGLLRLESLAAGLESDVVGTVMEIPGIVLPSSTRIEHAAEAFVTNDLDCAPVVDEGVFVGILTSNILLRELRRSRDPLTGLPWSDRLREWGTEQLHEGREITIVFFDIDEFGQYNKRYGHIVGDQVLKHFVENLRAHVDPETDVLVRYGGDEFVIGTLRDPAGVQMLVRDVTQSHTEAVQADWPEPIGFTVGLCGGRRTIERENIHYAATLDNLINLASKDCSSKKAPRVFAIAEERPSVALPDESAPAHPSAFRVVNVHDARKSAGSLTTVILAVGESVVSGVHSRSTESIHLSIAMATASALERAGMAMRLEVDDVFHEESPTGDRLVMVAGRLVADSASIPVSGVCIVENDVTLAVAMATLDACRQAIGNS